MNIEQAVTEMTERLRAASVRVLMLGESDIEPPCVVITLPVLRLGGPNPWPTDATFGLAAVVARDDRMLTNSMKLVSTVTRALDESTLEFAITNEIVPGTFPDGSNTLPAYLIQIEVALNDSESS